MKKYATIGVAMIGILAVTGFRIAAVREYLQVARNRDTSTVRSEIPLSVEIDRMEVLLKKLDGQVSQQQHASAIKLSSWHQKLTPLSLTTPTSPEPQSLPAKSNANSTSSNLSKPSAAIPLTPC